jgi:hypothetical protein
MYNLRLREEYFGSKRAIKQMLEKPRREVGLKRNNNKVIDASRRRSRPQSTG